MLQPFDNVWIFGSSVCLPFNLENPFDGWPNIIEQQLNTKCINLAQPAADNFFIYIAEYFACLFLIPVKDVVFFSSPCFMN